MLSRDEILRICICFIRLINIITSSQTFVQPFALGSIFNFDTSSIIVFILYGFNSAYSLFKSYIEIDKKILNQWVLSSGFPTCITAV